MTALEIAKARMARREMLYLVIHDEEAKRILAAWLAFGYQGADVTCNPNMPTPHLLLMLWNAGPSIDFEQLGNLANVPATRCEKVFSRLRAAGLVWPDGTIADQAGKLLRSESIAYVENLLPKGARAPYEPPRDNASRAGVSQPGDAGLPTGPAAEPGANPPRRRAPGAAGRAPKRNHRKAG